MNLLIDIGNSRSKVALVKDGKTIQVLAFDMLDEDRVEHVFEMFPSIKQCILASVGKVNIVIEKTLKKRTSYYLNVTGLSPMPIENLYRTPETLGVDRLAVAVGATTLFPETNLLVVDAGTAITLDLVNNKNQYLGGNIIPGIMMRFRALHQFTNALPLIDPQETEQLFGFDTETAIRCGIINGVRFEINGFIDAINEQYEHLQVVFTGGDANFFADKLKNSIFVDSNLMFTGLNRILEYNAKKR